MLREKIGQLCRIFDLFKIVAAMRPGRPDQNGGCRRKFGPQCGKDKSAPAFWRSTFGIRQPGIPFSRSATVSRVVLRTLRGSLTVGLSSRSTRSAANGNNASA